MLLEISRPLRSSWRASDKIYGLALVDLTRPFATKLTFGSASEAVIEFIFEINPKSLDTEEPASVVIIPTQNKGKYIEHQGSVFKNIRLSGTTGLRPKRGAGAIIPVVGVPNPFARNPIDNETLLPADEETGFDILIRLRNLFRTYWAAKEDPDLSHKIVMVWQNGHEGDFYIVEPLAFTARRDSKNPFTFTYDIQLKTICTYEIAQKLFEKSNPDFYKDVRSKAGALARVNNFTNSMKRYTSTVGASVNGFNNLVGLTAVTLLSVPNQLITDASNVLIGVSNTLSIPRGIIAYEATRIADAVNTYNEFRQANDEYFTSGLVTEKAALARNLNRLSVIMLSLANEETFLNNSSVSTSLSRAKSVYKDQVNGSFVASNSVSNIYNTDLPSATQKARVQKNETIQLVARRLLGNSGRWKELVLLNDLLAPYISESGDGNNVLRPGDTILYPAEISTNSTAIRSNLDATSETDPFVKSLGRDIRLIRVSDGGNTGLFDIAISAGDCDVVEGVENMQQAMELRFSTERGDLPEHPSYGVGLPIGTKGTITSLLGYQIDARSSILEDSRVEEINKLDFRLNGEVVNVSAQIRVKGVDNSLSVSFSRGR